jgi:S1-C subfamily serine protease
MLAKLADKKNSAQAVVINDQLENALVNVSFTSPYSIQGRSGNNSRVGTGVIVDVNKGWLVVSRSVVSSMLGDVKLVFNNRLEISAKVEYIHPLHNLALVSYSPTLLTNVAVAQVRLSKGGMASGETVLQMGLNDDGVVEYRETQVDMQEELRLRQFNVPQFIEGNIEVTYLLNPNDSIDGILVNSDKEVTALWSTFEQSDTRGKDIHSIRAGISVDYIAQLMTLVSKQQAIYSLDINLTQIAPVDALQMGLTETWLTKLKQQNPQADKLLSIYNVATSSPSAQVFKRGDILLAINDTPVTSFKQVETLSQQPQVTVTYFSQGQINTVMLNTTPLYGNDISQVFYWSGLYLHAPHRAAQLQGNVSAEGVYVASYSYGSPATRYGLYAMQRIVEIDGQAIATTDDFVNAVKSKQHQQSVLIKTLDFNNNPRVITLKVNNNYWPFYEIKYQNGQWQKVDLLLAKVNE